MHRSVYFENSYLYNSLSSGTVTCHVWLNIRQLFNILMGDKKYTIWVFKLTYETYDESSHSRFSRFN